MDYNSGNGGHRFCILVSSDLNTFFLVEVAVTQYWLASVHMTDVIKAPTPSLRTPVKTSKITDKPLIVCSGSNAW